MSEVGERLVAGAQSALSVARGDTPADAMTINGHKYISYEIFKGWSMAEVASRNPAVMEYILALEARAEEAEAALKERREHAAYLQSAHDSNYAEVRNDVLGGAQNYLRLQPSFGDGKWAANHLEALKSQS